MNIKIFIVDNDKDIKKQLESIESPYQFEIKLYSSSMEILSLIENEKPGLIFLNLEVKDLNDFIMYDLLKKTIEILSIPLFFTYSEQAQNNLNQYNKLKFKPNGYLKKPISNNEILDIFSKYFKTIKKKDKDEFSDENIDRLVRGELIEIEKVNNLEDTSKKRNEEIKIDKEIIEESITVDEEFEIALNITDSKSKGKKGSRVENELRNQVISLERQNEFLRSENKSLSHAIESLKTDINDESANYQKSKSDLDKITIEQTEMINQLKEKELLLQEEQKKVQEQIEEINQLKEKELQLQKEQKILQEQTEMISQLEDKVSLLKEEHKDILEKGESEKSNLLKNIDELRNKTSQYELIEKDLNNQLTDKERELVARNHEFEKDLKKRSEELLQEVENRLYSKFNIIENQLKTDLQIAIEEKNEIESSLTLEIEDLKKSSQELLKENIESKKREDSLNRTVSSLAEEKVTLSENVLILQDELSKNIEEMTEKQNQYSNDIEELKDEIKNAQRGLKDFQNQTKELRELLQKALSITQIVE